MKLKNPFEPLLKSFLEILRTYRLPLPIISALATLFGVSVVLIGLMMTVVLVQAITIYLVLYILSHLQ